VPIGRRGSNPLSRTLVKTDPPERIVYAVWAIAEAIGSPSHDREGSSRSGPRRSFTIMREPQQLACHDVPCKAPPPPWRPGEPHNRPITAAQGVRAGHVDQQEVFFAVANLLNLEVDLLFFDATSTYWKRDLQ